MQTLGLDPQSPSEGRLKSLFWPTVANDADVDNLTNQGFWICFIVAAITVVMSLAGGQYLGIVDALFFYLGGNGVRQRSKAAAICIFVVYAIETLAGAKARGSVFSVARYIFTAILLSNVRAIWIASARQKRGETDEPAVILNETFGDKLYNAWPQVLWPKLRIVFFIFAAVELLGASALLLHS